MTDFSNLQKIGMCCTTVVQLFDSAKGQLISGCLFDFF